MSNRYEYRSHCVFNLGYHVIFCPKYRRKVLQWGIDERLKILLVEKATAMGCRIEKMEVMPDHVHIFIKTPPTLAIDKVVQGLKGYTSFIIIGSVAHFFPQKIKKRTLPGVPFSRLALPLLSRVYICIFGIKKMNFIKKIFERRKQFKPQPKQLRIDGCKTSMTAAPDDSELAAQALLESRIYGDKEQRRKKQPLPQPIPKKEGERYAEYYRQLSEKIKEGHKQERHAAMRYVAYCEEKLTSDISHQPSDIATLEHGLFKHQDTVEREGGDLLKRWQKCLAECIVLEMKNNNLNENENG